MRGERTEKIRAQQKTYYERHKEEIKAKTKAYQEAHKEEIRLQRKEYRKAHREEIREQHALYYKMNKGRHTERSKDYHCKRNYGISFEEKEAIFASQGDCCAICHKEIPLPKNIHIDHDHKTGENRGILCANCNPKLGWLEDRELEITNYLNGQVAWEGGAGI